MNIVKPSFEIIEETNPLLKIELCGRVCYKSEDKISVGSAEKFVKNLIKRGHESVLEHADFIVRVSGAEYKYFKKVVYHLADYGIHTMLRTTSDELTGRYIISGNVRMWRDFMRDVKPIAVPPLFLQLFSNNILFEDVIPEPLYHCQDIGANFIDKSELLDGIETDVHRTETVRFIVDRGISHEIVRHRKASFSQESTRYCNYNNKGVTFIAPPFVSVEWVETMEFAEKAYNRIIEKGYTPQEARSVLPNSLKTEVVMTTNIRNWKHFFELRTSTAAHPQMREIAIPLSEEMRKIY